MVTDASKSSTRLATWAGSASRRAARTGTAAPSTDATIARAPGVTRGFGDRARAAAVAQHVHLREARRVGRGGRDVGERRSDDAIDTTIDRARSRSGRAVARSASAHARWCIAVGATRIGAATAMPSTVAARVDRADVAQHVGSRAASRRQAASVRLPGVVGAGAAGDVGRGRGIEHGRAPGLQVGEVHGGMLAQLRTARFAISFTRRGDGLGCTEHAQTEEHHEASTARSIAAGDDGRDRARGRRDRDDRPRRDRGRRPRPACPTTTTTSGPDGPRVVPTAIPACASGTTRSAGTCVSRTTRSTTACSRARSPRRASSSNVHAVRLERGDHAQGRSPTGTRIAFRFNNYGGIDGFDFTTHCAPALGFGFLSDGHGVGDADTSRSVPPSPHPAPQPVRDHAAPRDRRFAAGVRAR